MSQKETGKEFRTSGKLIAQVDTLSFASHERDLFANLSFVVKSGEVTAVTGESGSGKTSLLKILAGIERGSGGSVRVLTNNIGYLPQETDDVDISGVKPVIDLFKASLGLDSLETQIRKFEQLIAKDSSQYPKIASEFGDAMEKFQSLGGYEVETDVKRILAGLGIGYIKLDRSLSEVSSGQKRRILLALALYSSPDLLLLDDPTIHLDRGAVSWLTGYLKHQQSAVVIATNHNTFIDAVADQTIGFTDSSRTFVFAGGYKDFITKRDAVLYAEKLEAEQVAGKIKQLKVTDQMFRSKNAYRRSSDMAQVGRALGTRIDRLEAEHEEMPGSKEVYDVKTIPNLIFKSEHRSGRDVLQIDGVVKSYTPENEAVSLSGKKINIQRGEKWLIWGPNGSGKSTLVKTIIDTGRNGSFLPDRGTIRIGAGVKIAYGAPDESQIPSQGNILEVIRNLFDHQNDGKISATLHFFGFTGSQIYRQDIRSLSTGEKRRLDLACLMLTEPNLLILDEPTGDYLTEEIKERLAKAIAKYDGTLILVSHDREFIDKVGVNHVLDMPSGRTRLT